MYKQIKLLKQNWNKKLTTNKQRYESRESDSPVYTYFKLIYEKNEILCRSCLKSLKPYIGKDIIVNTQHAKKHWYCVPCGKILKLI